MNKKEGMSLGIFLVSIFLIVIILFVGVNKEVVVKIDNGKSIRAPVPRSFGPISTGFLMILSAAGGASLFYYFTDYSKKISLTKKQQVSANLLEGDVRKVYLYVLEHNPCLQKDLVYELQMPKAKVTRILHKLDQKGILKRISYGKTNKVVIE
ncbi:MAG: hypothetical protein QF632_04635 [Candidatus Woesearchaeota archaeon]|jgi:hypothetical protein|nr:hypothetical protein [Candidatus Woesearchaeota archaeon]MDP7324019.1 hypothetical protein [Candidatus Woesearchaeota archaeon]MDP7457459.1 hypothetical protein [Candidatus Woesearchaeota archaeon]